MQRMVQSTHVRVLLATLVATFIGIPLIEKLGPRAGRDWVAFLIQLFMAQALLGGVYAVSSHKLMRRLISWSVIGSLVISALMALGWAPESLALRLVEGVLLLVGYFLIAFAMTHHLMLERRVTFDTLASALAVYILFGLAWGMIYKLAEVYDPARSFRGLSTAVEVTSDLGTPMSVLIYYSFTTLTTLGYGDIVPVKPMVRSLAILEAAAGQIYIAVLVARLVGIHTALQLTAEPDKPDQRVR